MTYATNNFDLFTAPNLIESTFGMWCYRSTDSLATIFGAGYVSDASKKGVKVGDLVLVVNAASSVVALVTVASITTGAATLQPLAATGGEVAVTTTTITTLSTSTTPFGYATSTQANAIATEVAATAVLVNQIRADLVAAGLIKGS